MAARRIDCAMFSHNIAARTRDRTPDRFETCLQDWGSEEAASEKADRALVPGPGMVNQVWCQKFLASSRL